MSGRAGRISEPCSPPRLAACLASAACSAARAAAAASRSSAVCTAGELTGVVPERCETPLVVRVVFGSGRAGSTRDGSTRDIDPVKVPVERSARSRARCPSTACTAFSALAAAARARSATRIGWLRILLASISGASRSPPVTALVTASSIEAGAARPPRPSGTLKLRGSGTPGARPRRDSGPSSR